MHFKLKFYSDATDSPKGLFLISRTNKSVSSSSAFLVSSTVCFFEVKE